MLSTLLNVAKINPAVSATVTLLIMIFLFLIVLGMRYNKTLRPKRVRQPLIDGRIGKDPVKNAMEFAQLFDGNARHAKRKLHIAEFADLAATGLVMVLAGEVPSLIIKMLGVVSFLAKGIIGTYKLRETWRSSRTAYQDLARFVEDFLEETISREEFMDGYRRVKLEESNRFRQLSERKESAPDHKLVGQ
jgi:hypothetical protein